MCSPCSMVRAASSHLTGIRRWRGIRVAPTVGRTFWFSNRWHRGVGSMNAQRRRPSVHQTALRQSVATGFSSGTTTWQPSCGRRHADPTTSLRGEMLPDDRLAERDVANRVLGGRARLTVLGDARVELDQLALERRLERARLDGPPRARAFL